MHIFFSTIPQICFGHSHNNKKNYPKINEWKLLSKSPSVLTTWIKSECATMNQVVIYGLALYKSVGSVKPASHTHTQEQTGHCCVCKSLSTLIDHPQNKTHFHWQLKRKYFYFLLATYHHILIQELHHWWFLYLICTSPNTQLPQTAHHLPFENL